MQVALDCGLPKYNVINCSIELQYKQLACNFLHASCLQVRPRCQIWHWLNISLSLTIAMISKQMNVYCLQLNHFNSDHSDEILTNTSLSHFTYILIVINLLSTWNFVLNHRKSSQHLIKLLYKVTTVSLYYKIKPQIKMQHPTKLLAILETSLHKLQRSVQSKPHETLVCFKPTGNYLGVSNRRL